MIDTLLNPIKPLTKLSSKTIFALNPSAFEPLQPHIHKTLEIKLEDIQSPLFLQIQDKGLAVVDSTISDVKIKGKTSNIIKVFLANEQGPHTLMQNQVSVIGDTNILQALSQTKALAQPDFAHWLARLTNDLVAQSVISFAQKGLEFLKSISENRAQDFADYASIESEMVVSKVEHDDFAEKVQTLRDEVEKLKSRILKLQS